MLLFVLFGIMDFSKINRNNGNRMGMIVRLIRNIKEFKLFRNILRVAVLKKGKKRNLPKNGKLYRSSKNF